jgi:hypothetical protein
MRTRERPLEINVGAVTSASKLATNSGGFLPPHAQVTPPGQMDRRQSSVNAVTGLRSRWCT